LRKLTIEQLDLRGKRVFIRADLNAPLVQGQVSDDTRLRAVLPTIQLALKAGDLFGISMVLIDGQIKIGRSRNTPPAARAAEVLKGHGPAGGGH